MTNIGVGGAGDMRAARLVALVDACGHALAEGNRRGTSDELLSRLVVEIGDTISAEEALLARQHDPKVEAHRLDHDRLLRCLSVLTFHYESGLARDALQSWCQVRELVLDHIVCGCRSLGQGARLSSL